MILILGNGDLAKALKKKIPDAIIVGKPNFDFSIKKDCDRLTQLYPNPTHLINTIGVFDSEDIWKNLLLNFVVPCYIASWYINHTQCHVINISSASAWWVSYPGLDFSRFSYNLAKESLSSFGKHVNRITIDDTSKGCLTTIEPGAFLSRMSKFKGQNINNVVSCVELAIEKKLQHISCIKNEV